MSSSETTTTDTANTTVHFQEQQQDLEETSSISMSTSVEEAVVPVHHYNSDDDNDDTKPPPSNRSSAPLSERVKHRCYPYGCSVHTIPLALCIVSLVCTFAGSWDCSYFEGASISFTDSYYGLWTLKDTFGKCQLWDVLFFSYNLGAPLRAARVFSMAAMMLGLALAVTHAQALQLHAVSWVIPIAILILMIVSMSSTKTFNMWILFWLFTYIIYVVIVRALFLHPVHRRISRRGSKIIASLHVVCSVSCLLTLVVLRSDYCTCDNLTIDSLEGRDPGDPCDNACELHWAGVVMIISCFFWMTTAVFTLKIGVQPKQLHSNGTEHLFGFYRNESFATRVLDRLNTFRTRNESDESSNESSDDSSRNGTEENAESGSTESYDDDDEEKDKSEGETKGELTNEDMVDTRGRCQRLCCDFRVVPRTRKEKVIFWTVRVLLGALFVVYVFIVVFLIGTRAESTFAAKAPDTTPFFVLDEVCAFHPLDPWSSFETFPSKQQANDAGYAVAHCGACGSCSNPADIEKYVKTRKTFVKKSKDCGIQSVFGNYDKLISCLEDKIGFSRDCTFCWAQNMKDTVKYCLFTCTTTMIRGFMQSNNVAGVGDEAWLNSCFFCDERRSAPGFVKCSGVARRRMGIESDVERRPEELCVKTDVDWLNVDWPELFPDQ